MLDRIRRFFDVNKRIIVCLVLIAGVVSLPLMTDYILQGENVQNSLSRIELFREGLAHVFPLHIQPMPGPEYGYGAASFQADVFYVIPALLCRIGMDLQSAYKLFLWLANIVTAAIAYVCFWKCFGRRDIGLIGSMLYTWCPWRCSDIYLAGDLGESAAWCFLPILLLGLVRLYREERTERLWKVFTAAFLLLLLSSMTFFVIGAGTALLWLIFMGRNTLKKDRLLTILKTAAATGLLGAWFLVPLLYFTYKNPIAVGSLIPGDLRAAGLYPLSFLLPFFRGGSSAQFWENGMANTLAASAGFAVTVCVLFYLWSSFTKRYKTEAREVFGGRQLLAAAVLLWLAGNSFPWELVQNKNLFFSVFLAWMHTPAKWGIGACLILLFLACHALYRARKEKESLYRMYLGITVGIAFFTTQFLLGNILYKTEGVRIAAAGEWQKLPMQIITQLPMLWRIAELVSAITLVALIAVGIIRRRKGAERVGISKK